MYSSRRDGFLRLELKLAFELKGIKRKLTAIN